MDTYPDTIAPSMFKTSNDETTPTEQLGRDGMVDAGLVGGQSRVTIARDSPDDVGFREIFVSIDGEPVAILKHQDSFTTELTPGEHRIRAHNTLFWKTHDIVLKPGEHAKFDAINKAGFGTFSFITFLGASPLYLTFERRDS